MDTLRLYVVWHPEFVHGETFARSIAEHFDGLGMVRDNVRLSVPVRVRAWNGSKNGVPRQISVAEAEVNAIVLLTESRLNHAIDRGDWGPYLEELGRSADASANTTFVFNVAFNRRAETVLQGLTASCFQDLQAHRFYLYAGGKTEPSLRAVRRLLLHIVNVTGYRLRAAQNRSGRERIFLSHAKADGQAIAKSIRDYIKNVPFEVECFLDTHDLVTGNNYRQQFREDIASSAFFLVHTDTYGDRPFCRWELLRAKEYRRPILSGFRLEKGEQRTFPYNGNVPSKPLPVTSSSMGEPTMSEDRLQGLLIDMMSEVLRCRIWERTAQRACDALRLPGTVLLPRPPELLDLAFLVAAQKESGRESEPLLAVYPDPPIDRSEWEVLDKLRGPIEFRALSELWGVSS